MIFDLDGTLVDSTTQISEAMQFARKSLGLGELPENFIASQLGKPIRDLIPETKLDAKFEDNLITIFRNTLKLSILEGNRVFPSADELVRKLKSEGCLIGIATSKPQCLAELVVQNSELEGLIDVIQGTDNFPPKPHPEVILRILGNFQGHPAIMIGDRAEDILAATSAKIPALGVAQSAHSSSKLISHGARKSYSTIREVLLDVDTIFSITRTAISLAYQNQELLP